MKSFSTVQLVRAALIAAIYAILALSFPEFSYGIIQFRLSEALVLLPLFFPEAIPGLIVGCFLANLGSPFGIIDILGGTLCTAAAAYLTYRFRHNTIIAAAAPIVINGFGVSAYVAFLSQEMYFAVVPFIMLSEAVVVVVLALPLAILAARSIRVSQ